MQEVPSTVNATALLERLRGWARELGFSQIAVADVDLSSAEPGLQAWLDAGHHGRMHYMAAHGLKRARQAELVPGTLRVVTARMDYLPRTTKLATEPGWQAVEWAGLATPEQAQISIYARGRDYHKVLRQRLQKLAEKLEADVGPLGYRVFTDSAPVLEVELAARSGLGWRCTARPARCSSSASYSSTWPCRSLKPSARIAASAAPASMSAPLPPSPRPTVSTRGAASPT